MSFSSKTEGKAIYCKRPGCTEKPILRGKYCNSHRTGKKCVEIDCTNIAQGKSDYCKGHGGGRRCIANCCTKSAIGKTDYCIEHGGGKRCVEKDCKKSAIDKTDYCKGHGGGRRCIANCCTKSARSKSDYCIEHGGGRRCIQKDCSKSAIDKTDYCKGHGGGKRCVEKDCTKSAIDKTDYCVEHGGGRRCIEKYCTKSARSKSDYCVEHGGGYRCPNCITWPDSRSGSSKYDGYCATCFKHLFPSDPRSTVIYQHTKEIRVRNAINQRFDGFVHDRPLYTGHCDCTHRRRIDHRKLIGGTILAIETDEFAHRNYDEKDEEIRYDDLYMIHSGKWVYIRFNPDKTATCDTDLEDRIEVLLQEMDRQIERIEEGKNQELVEIIRLYYS
jgi:hypothetical protein